MFGFLIASLLNLAFASDVSGIDLVESRNGDLVSYRTWQEKNMEIIDWQNPIRNQGAVGSCQSFGFLGIIESQVSLKQGASIDLSERYQLYSSYMDFASMGDKPGEIAQFPEKFLQRGALPESLYPYSEVSKNETIFAVDSAQGLENVGEPAIMTAIKGKVGEERSLALQQPEILGALPEGATPVKVPVLASAIDVNRPMRFVTLKSKGTTVPCFSTESEKSQLQLSPAEFAVHCLEFKVSDWEVRNEYDTIARMWTMRMCKQPEVMKQVVESGLERRAEALRVLINRLEAKNAGMLAMSVPTTREGKKSVLWTAADTEVHAGHAVVALGYLTAQDLRLPANQRVGMLGTGLFDQMAALYDERYLAPTAILNEVGVRDHRVASLFGQKILREQGIFIVRNSWGDVPGLGGYQAFTFDFMMAHLMLTISTTAQGLNDLTSSGVVVEKTPLAAQKLEAEIRGIVCPK